MELKRTPDFLVMYPDLALCPKITGSDLERDAALYIHVPFCRSFCHYCTFHKSRPDPELIARYLRALPVELELVARTLLTRRYRLRAVYFGGGTPSLLEPRQVAAVVDRLHALYNLSDECEVSLECLPSPDLTVERFRDLRGAGINRVSIGFQSFDDGLLRALGRSHTTADSVGTFERARKAGITNLHLDLMYALPGQTLDVWEDSLRRAMELDPAHISAYPIIIFHGSKLWRLIRKEELPRRPGEQLELEMNRVAVDMLAAGGYRQYSGTEFARPGMACRYIMYSWGGRDFYGVGPSAYGYLDPLALANTTYVTEYCRRLEKGRLPLERGKTLTSLERMRRDAAMGILLMELDGERFQGRHGLAVEDVFGDTVAELLEAGLVERLKKGGGLRLTDKGVLYLPQVMAAFTEYRPGEYLRLPV